MTISALDSLRSLKHIVKEWYLIMGWTDNREQGLTGRKRPCAPRSSQLQTSIIMIIYPVLTKCTGSMFHQRPVNRHCLGKFMGTDSQGQVGKQASHWWLPGKGRKEAKERKICLLHRWKNNLLQSICRRQHLLSCCLSFFFFAFFPPCLCCLSEWEMGVY